MSSAKLGDLEASARVRVFPPLPYEEGFDDIEGRGRPYWIGAGRYQVADLDGEKVLEKPVAEAGLLRSKLFIGPPDLRDYTIEAEIRGSLKGRRKTDGGLINSGYILDLLGNSQKLEIRTWTAVRRIATAIPFEWDMDRWYHLKLRVDRDGDMAIARGKGVGQGRARARHLDSRGRRPAAGALGRARRAGVLTGQLLFRQRQGLRQPLTADCRRSSLLRYRQPRNTT